MLCMTSPHDDELLRRARAGDQTALGDLLRHHNQLLVRMARREIGGRLQARLSAADLVQQTCLSAIRNLNEFQGENQQQFAAWLCAIHQRNLRDAVRRHVQAGKRAVSAQEGSVSNHDEATDEQTPSQRAALDESRGLVQQAISTLPEDQAIAVRLRHLEQRTLREIADQMERSEVAVASLLKRGLNTLRQQFGSDLKNM